MCKVFSAVDALSSKSSIVAIKVASLSSNFMSVVTLLLSRWVFTVKPGGVLKLSGETASAIAVAVFASPYSSVTVASNALAPQLFAH